VRQQSVGVGQAGVRERVLRVLDQRLLEEIERLAQPFLGPLVQVIAALQVQVVRREILREPTDARSGPPVSELGLEPVHDRRRDAFLRPEHVVDRRVDRFRPQIAAVRAVDEPVGALKTRIISSYATYITQPVEVTPVLRVRVLGAVKTPGIYKVEPAMTLADAIALAGGTSPDANVKRIRLIRDGRPLDVALTPDAMLADSPLRPGDQVFVPERSWLSRNPGTIVGAMSATATLLWAIRR